MANRLTRAFRALFGRDEAARSQLTDYVNTGFTFNGVGYWPPYGGQVRKNREEIENSFTGYVTGAYKSDGVVFATILARLLLFTEARFQWQHMLNGRPQDLFGDKALNILETPWPNGTTGELLARMEQDISLAGNFYAVRDGDRIRRLRPDWVSIVLTAPPDEAIASDVAGYAYYPGGITSGSTPEIYPVDEMCHWSPIPDPEAQFRGMSWLTPVLQEVIGDKLATVHKNKFFENGATLQTVFLLKETVTGEQFKEFIRLADEAHVGVDNAYKPLYMGGGADAKVIGADLKQLDFKAVQGAQETRIAAAAGVPPIIVGLSEGLASATYSNYAMARRKFGDHWARPQWRSACAALQVLTDVPEDARLWYDDRDIAFLREDQKDAAEIGQIRASTINTYITAGFTPESAVAAVDGDDLTLLVHTGMVSVQLQPPGQGVPTDTAAGEQPGETTPPEQQPAEPTDADVQALNDALDEISSGASRSADDAWRALDRERLHHYWTRDPEGLAKWVESPHPWTSLRDHLLKHVGPGRAERMAAEWFHEVMGFWPGSDTNRVVHGKPPRGHLVGPG